jgi:pyruvate formate-lyase/glycerol dehydratase family glycyl radical enzyme
MGSREGSNKVVDKIKLTRGQRLWNKLIDLRRTAPISLERARLLTESFKETEGLPTPIRRARAFEKILCEIPIYIDDEQLLAGDSGSCPMTAEWHPEASVEWVLERFSEGKGNLLIKDEDARVMREIAEYWKNRTAEARYFLRVGKKQEEWLKSIDLRGSWLCMPVHLNQGWNTPGFHKAIQKGFSGILAEVENELKATLVLDEASYHKRIFLEALTIVINAGIRYAGRYAALAKEMAKTAKPARKAELEKMAKVCEWVPANPARTFQEALQTMWFCYLFIYLDIHSSGISPGRVDQYLYPYYKKDIEEGRITREEAIQLLELLRCKYSSYREFAEKAMTEAGSGEAEWFNCVLGGVTADGKDAVNELSFLWLEAARRVGSPHPTLSVRVHENLDPDFALKAAEVCALGRGYPAWFGDRTNIAYLLKNGTTLEDARNYAIAGCTLASIPGKMCGARVFFGNIAKMFEFALHNGVDPRTGKQLSIETGKFEDFQTYEELWEAFVKQIRHWMKQLTAIHNESEIFYASVVPALASSLFYDDCIQRGLPANGGGCHYQQGMWYLLPTGPIDVADSLAAIKKCVFEDKTVSKKQLIKAISVNFKGEVNQEVRRRLLSSPKYGNDDDYVDYIASDIYTMLDTELSQLDGPFGTKYVCSPHSVSSHGPMGEKVGALPSGRLAGLALADGNMSPSQGMDKCGPTAVIKSAGKIDQLPLQGTLFNQKFHPSALKTRDDLNKFLALIKTYLIDFGGKHIQFNVVDRKTLLEAREHPEDHKSLVVRVAGYSALWIELSCTVQDEIIARTEQTW